MYLTGYCQGAARTGRMKIEASTLGVSAQNPKVPCLKPHLTGCVYREVLIKVFSIFTIKAINIK